jgi:hypothetical protein
MRIIIPDQFDSTDSHTLLEAAALGRLSVDQRLLRALLDDPDRTLPGIVKFANSKAEWPVDLGLDLIRIFCVQSSVDALPFLLREIRRFPEDVPAELSEALVRVGTPAVEPLLKMQPSVDAEGGDLLFELACLGIRDDRIEKRIRDKDPETRDFLMGIYEEHSSGDATLEPFDIWSLYPEEEEPDFEPVPLVERLEFLDSPWPPHREAAAATLLHMEHDHEITAKLLALATDDDDMWVRAMCWEALREDSDQAPVRKALLARLADTDVSIAERVSTAIGAAYLHPEHPVVGETLREAFEDEELRAKAVEGMWRTLDQGFGELITPLLEADDTPEDVLSEAIVAVGLLRMVDEMPRLEMFMQSTKYRAEAMHAYVLAWPGETTRESMKQIKETVRELADGFEEDEEETVDYAVSLRMDLAGVPHEPTKVGRNELCPCGSRKKYKKCCGA